jgi:hypothetical protein
MAAAAAAALARLGEAAAAEALGRVERCSPGGAPGGGGGGAGAGPGVGARTAVSLLWALRRLGLHPGPAQLRALAACVHAGWGSLRAEDLPRAALGLADAVAYAASASAASASAASASAASASPVAGPATPVGAGIAAAADAGAGAPRVAGPRTSRPSSAGAAPAAACGSEAAPTAAAGLVPLPLHPSSSPPRRGAGAAARQGLPVVDGPEAWALGRSGGADGDAGGGAAAGVHAATAAAVLAWEDAPLSALRQLLSPRGVASLLGPPRGGDAGPPPASTPLVAGTADAPAGVGDAPEGTADAPAAGPRLSQLSPDEMSTLLLGLARLGAAREGAEWLQGYCAQLQASVGVTRMWAEWRGGAGGGGWGGGSSEARQARRGYGLARAGCPVPACCPSSPVVVTLLAW